MRSVSAWRSSIRRSASAFGSSITPAFALFNGDVLYSYLAGLQSPHVMTVVHSVDFEIRSMIVWDKGRLVPGRAHYQWQHEMVIYGVRRGCTAGWIGPTNETSVCHFKKRS